MTSRTQNETVAFKKTAEGELLLDIHHTQDKWPKACVAFFHGGALLLGSRSDLPNPVIQFLNGKGLHVCALDYRVAPKNSVQDIFEDVRDGCRFVKQRFSGLPLVTIGYSAGAYLTLLNGAMGEPVHGICAFAGYGDLGAPWYYEKSEFFLKYKNVDRVRERLAQGEAFSTLEERIDLYVYLRQTGTWPHFVLGEKGLEDGVNKFSPLKHVTRNFPRTVLIHGTADNDVPYETSLAMARSLAACGVEHKLISMQGMDHDLFAEMERASVLGAWNEALRFLMQ